MDRYKRSQRIAVMVRILTQSPNRLFTLGYFCEKFSAAKTSISEDINLTRQYLEEFGMGTLETVSGAAGGVRFLPSRREADDRAFLEKISERLSGPERILPGGYLYMNDLLQDPELVTAMGEIMAMWFCQDRPDYVVTLETKGIPVALMVARSLNVPLIICRRNLGIADGSVVTINYVTGTSGGIQTMSLPKRSIQDGKRAVIIDDFMRGGGSVRGMMDMMREFSVEVTGIGVVMATAQPEKKLVQNAHSLLTLYQVDEAERRVKVGPTQY